MRTPLFSFAVLSDTHITPEDGRSNSPWRTNRLANARARRVVEEINEARVDFALHLGDVVHPVPSVPTHEAAVRRAKEILGWLACPLHVVPGNHDVGDKAVEWMPAEIVNAGFLARYRRFWGRDFYSFDHKGCHFAMLDSLLLNSSLPDERRQRAWLERDLRAHRGGRIVVAAHYPPFLLEPGEPENYDDVGEPARSWLLSLLEENRVEAFFAGHVHCFHFHVHGRTRIYTLPSTVFFRLDFSELFRAAPAAEDEFARNDEGKLGYFLVNVHEGGIAVHPVRLSEARLGTRAAASGAGRFLSRRHPLEIGRAPCGFELRAPWAEVQEIPYSGALDEFHRKRARNDYPLLGLWELGAKKLRIPANDLADPLMRRRVADLKAEGHEFACFRYGLPSSAEARVLAAARRCYESLEIILPWREMARRIGDIAGLSRLLRRPVLLSKLWTRADVLRDAARYVHNIMHGFMPADRARIGSLRRKLPGRDVLTGVSFRLGRSADPGPFIAACARVGESLDLDVHVTALLASDDNAMAEVDERRNERRVLAAVRAAWAAGVRCSVYFDTLADVDRGYFPRAGFYDRQWNPKPLALAFRNLSSRLETEDGF